MQVWVAEVRKRRWGEWGLIPSKSARRIGAITGVKGNTEKGEILPENINQHFASRERRARKTRYRTRLNWPLRIPPH
jgi:hypothetical protein